MVQLHPNGPPANRMYNLLVPETKKRGIGRTTAFRLAKLGLLDTFLIGRRRYVFIDSLDTLPERLASSQPI